MSVVAFTSISMGGCTCRTCRGPQVLLSKWFTQPCSGLICCLSRGWCDAPEHEAQPGRPACQNCITCHCCCRQRRSLRNSNKVQGWEEGRCLGQGTVSQPSASLGFNFGTLLQTRSGLSCCSCSVTYRVQYWWHWRQSDRCRFLLY